MANEHSQQPFVDPYAEFADDMKQRINADVASGDLMLVRSVCPVRGVIQAMINMYFKSVVDEMRERDIVTYGQRQEFIEIIRRRTAPSANTDGPQPAHTGGTPRVREGNAITAAIDANAQGQSRKRRVTKKAKSVNAGSGNTSQATQP